MAWSLNNICFAFFLFCSCTFRNISLLVGARLYYYCGNYFLYLMISHLTITCVGLGVRFPVPAFLFFCDVLQLPFIEVGMDLSSVFWSSVVAAPNSLLETSVVHHLIQPSSSPPIMDSSSFQSSRRTRNDSIYKPNSFLSSLYP